MPYLQENVNGIFRFLIKKKKKIKLTQNLKEQSEFCKSLRERVYRLALKEILFGERQRFSVQICSLCFGGTGNNAANHRVVDELPIL